MQKKSDFIKKSPLPQVGIEPTTYGFSERTNKRSNIVKRLNFNLI